MKWIITGADQLGKKSICQKVADEHKIPIAIPTPTDETDESSVVISFNANGKTYALQKKDVEAAKLILLHPENIVDFVEAMPSEDFMIVEIRYDAEDGAYDELAIRQNPNEKNIVDRLRLENERRGGIIRSIRNKTTREGNDGRLHYIADIKHDFTVETESGIARLLARHIHMSDNLINIIETMIKDDLIDAEDGLVTIVNNSNGKKTTARVPVVAEIAIIEMESSKTFAMGMLSQWLSRSDTIIPPPVKIEENEE